MGGHDRFEERGRLMTKSNITFFVGNKVLNIFIYQFFRKKIFSRIIMKNNFGSITIFEGKRSRTTKMSNIFFGK